MATRQQIEAELDRQSLPTAANAGDFGNPALRAALAEAEKNEAAIARIRETINNLTIQDAKLSAETAVDPIKKINRQYDDMAAAAEKAAVGNQKLAGSLKGVLTGIEKQRAAALEAQRETTRTRSERLPAVTSAEVARLIGAPITSGKRTAAQNAAAGGAANSYHLSGQAIDIPLRVNGKPLTKEGIRAALEPAGIAIKELLGPGDKGHADHFHVAFAKARKGADELAAARARAAEAAQRETERLARVSDSAAESVLRISSAYDDQPRLIDRVKISMDQLEDVRRELLKPDNIGADGKSLIPGADKILADLEKAKGLVADAINRPLREMLETSREQEAVDLLRLENRELEARVLERALALQKQKGPLAEAEVEAIVDLVAAEQRRTVEMEKQTLVQQRNLDLISRTQDNVRDTIGELLSGKGLSSIGNFFERQFNTYIDGLTDQISEALFGDVFREQKLKILGLDKVDKAGQGNGRQGQGRD